MDTRRRQTFILPLLPLLPLLPAARAAERPMLIGTYELQQMKAMKGLTLPRVLLYDAAGKLIERESWPVTLSRLKQAAGDAFCCVSDKPSPPGWRGPPPDCKIVVHGENVEEHFVGLKGADGRPIRYADLPDRKYLVVEYFASWCAPCIPARQELQAFLATPGAQDTVVLVLDFSKLAPGK